jgi:hypothetical protein
MGESGDRLTCSSKVLERRISKVRDSDSDRRRHRVQFRHPVHDEIACTSPSQPQGGGDRLKDKVYELRRCNFRTRRHLWFGMDFHVVEGAPGARVARRQQQQARIGFVPMGNF